MTANLGDVIGMVFQQFNLRSHMTVMQNVIEAPSHLRARDDEREQIEALAVP